MKAKKVVKYKDEPLWNRISVDASLGAFIIFLVLILLIVALLVFATPHPQHLTFYSHCSDIQILYGNTPYFWNCTVAGNVSVNLPDYIISSVTK